ncbi:aldose 1-epimerase family protein [bacterium]|nr:aldose 1-epimerase family protein [bacterium]
MAELFHLSLKKKDILERVGDISQICDARKKVYTDGKSTGVEIIDVTTGSGLAFSVLPSRGLDISAASFKSEPIAWKSATGEVSPAFYEPEGYGWLRGFFGGLLTTCGMTYSSHPCEDDGEQLGLHGRVSNIPAEDVNIHKTWEKDDYHLTVSGIVRETKVFGHKLVLSRTIRTSLGSSSLIIEDVVENTGFSESPLMMLYHVNIGWPVLSEHSRLVSPTAGVRPADDEARREIDQWSTFLPPQDAYRERVYFHNLTADAQGRINLALVNESRARGVYLSFLKEDFPHFVQWKMMGKGEYVVGIEPGNITGNRAQMRKDGSLEFIKPGARRSFTLEIGVLDGNDSIKSFTETILNPACS